MSINEMDSKARTYFEIMVQIEQLQQEAENIKDSLKAQMMEWETEDLEGDGWRATWHNTNSRRFDGKALKRDNPNLYERYMISTTGTRFTLNQLKVEA